MKEQSKRELVFLFALAIIVSIIGISFAMDTPTGLVTATGEVSITSLVEVLSLVFISSIILIIAFFVWTNKIRVWRRR